MHKSLLLIALLAAAPLMAQTAPKDQGDRYSGVPGASRSSVVAQNGMVATSHPLATQDNVSAAARGIGGRIDPARDLVVVYLTSHGAPEAFISTSLPNEANFPPINSTSLATALSQAGIRRRVVIVSACFSGSWIPALANDDTIVITAAAKDRTSFGCETGRDFTYFGEAFFRDALAKTGSFTEAFELAKAAVTEREKKEGLTPSQPQLWVGPAAAAHLKKLAEQPH